MKITVEKDVLSKIAAYLKGKNPDPVKAAGWLNSMIDGSPEVKAEKRARSRKKKPESESRIKPAAKVVVQEVKPRTDDTVQLRAKNEEGQVIVNKYGSWWKITSASHSMFNTPPQWYLRSYACNNKNIHVMCILKEEDPNFWIVDKIDFPGKYDKRKHGA